MIKNYYKRVTKCFLCAMLVINIFSSSYAYEEDFFYKSYQEFIDYVQNDLTYFGESFSSQDYDSLLEITNLYKNDLKYSINHTFDFEPLKQELASKDNFLDYVLLTGDSYSGNLKTCLMKYYDYKNPVLENAGHTVKENFSIYKSAIYSKYPIIVISTSVNDVLRQTPPYTFKQIIEDLFDSARLNEKVIIVHTNCNFFVNGVSANNSDLYYYRPKLYDEIIKLTSKKYENVVYVDCKDIATRDYLSPDDIHYNEKFHFQLAEKIYTAIRGLVYGWRDDF